MEFFYEFIVNQRESKGKGYAEACKRGKMRKTKT